MRRSHRLFFMFMALLGLAAWGGNLVRLARQSARNESGSSRPPPP